MLPLSDSFWFPPARVFSSMRATPVAADRLPVAADHLSVAGDRLPVAADRLSVATTKAAWLLFQPCPTGDLEFRERDIALNLSV
jgi:hypothetical protein